ncbi:MAG: multiheme c-type cytochrome [Gammaproteobacteria bacterium]
MSRMNPDRKTVSAPHHPRRIVGLALTALATLTLFNAAHAADAAPPSAESQQALNAYVANPGQGKLRHLPSEACAGCHQQIYQQWRGSMHANSTAFKDPIHDAMYRKVMGDPAQENLRKKGKYPMCLKCHAPTAARDKKTNLLANPAYNEGVSCVTCHSAKRFIGVHTKEGKLNLGVNAYEYGETLQGPSGRHLGPQMLDDQGRPNALTMPPDLRPKQDAAQAMVRDQAPQGGFHPIALEGNPALLRTANACLGCHEQRNNGNGVPLCNTGAEFRQTDTATCQQCHMPVNNGFADHSMAGGHVKSMLERAVIVTVQAAAADKGTKATVSLQNTLPHNAPTGAPFRNMYVKVSALDASGKVVWSNYQKHPIKEDPKSMFMLKLLGDDGKPAGPSVAKKLGPDTRLKPLETRVIEYDIPVAGVKRVQAELHYDLLLPPQKASLKTVPAALKQPQIIAYGEARL